MTSEQHQHKQHEKHDWHLQKVKSSLIHTREPVEYTTFQCEHCGYFPNSDFEKNRLREKCGTCLEMATMSVMSKMLTVEERAMLKEKYMSHVKAAHPEIGVLDF